MFALGISITRRAAPYSKPPGRTKRPINLLLSLLIASWSATVLSAEMIGLLQNANLPAAIAACRTNFRRVSIVLLDCGIAVVHFAQASEQPWPLNSLPLCEVAELNQPASLESTYEISKVVVVDRVEGISNSEVSDGGSGGAELKPAGIEPGCKPGAISQC